MKRVIDDDSLHYSPEFDALPTEILGQILSWSGRPALGLLSKRFFDSVSKPSADWLSSLLRESLPYASDSVLLTGPRLSNQSMEVMYMHKYMEEVAQTLSQKQHLASGLTARLSLFLLRALDEYVWLRGQHCDGICWVNRFALLQCGLYYLRDLKHKPLAALRFHPRDFRANFFDEGHAYILAVRPTGGAVGGLWYLATNIQSDLRGVLSKALISTTGLNDQFFEHFDEDIGIARMKCSRNWDNPQLNKAYYGMNDDQIKEAWKKARENGTRQHLNLELYCNGLEYDSNSVEFGLFKKFEAELVTGQWEPYVTEKLVYDEELMLTGQVDMIYWSADPAKRVRDADGRLPIWLVDWKFAKDLLKYSDQPLRVWRGEVTNGGKQACTADLVDCKISHYRCQLLQYCAPLERHYQMACGDRISIVGMHKDQENFICYNVKREEDRIAAMRQYRLEQVAARVLTGLIVCSEHPAGCCPYKKSVRRQGVSLSTRVEHDGMRC